MWVRGLSESQQFLEELAAAHWVALWWTGALYTKRCFMWQCHCSAAILVMLATKQIVTG